MCILFFAMLTIPCPCPQQLSMVRGGTVPSSAASSPAAARALSVSSEPAISSLETAVSVAPPKSVSLTTTPTLQMPPSVPAPPAPRAVDAAQETTPESSPTRRQRQDPPSSGSDSDSEIEAFTDEPDQPSSTRVNFDEASNDENDIDVEAMSGVYKTSVLSLFN